jgi:hypothetical protein
MSFITRLRVSVLFSIALIGLLLAGAAQAQILNGTITGTVKDPTEAVVPNAAVTVTDLSTNQQYKTTTDESGVFTVANLPNGFYKVIAEHPGFAKTEVASVQVFVSQISRVPLKLEVAKTGTEVIVEAQATTVQTESAELKNTIDRTQIMELPLNSRNPMDLVKSFAGIITAGGSGDAFVHGLKGNATNLTQDGINVADNYVKTSAFFAISAPTVDTVGEFNVSVGGIGADAGFGAAQVSIVTQRGTNQFHGSAFWFQRTNELNANTWFNNQAGIARPFQLQQRLGANGGGPVYIPKIYNGKNRTWVFGTYEAYREPLSRGRTRTVLTDTARTGAFTYNSTTGGVQTVNLLNLGTIGTTGIKPTVNQDLMGLYNNYVPSTGLTDSGCSNGDGRNVRCFVFNLPGKNITDRYTLRVDHQITTKHSASFVFNQADFDSTPDLLNAIEPQFPKSPTGGQGSRRQVLVWAVQSIFGNNKTNEARAGYQRAPVGFNYPYNFSDFGGVQLNTAGSLSNPVLTSTNLPQGRNTPVRQAIDNFSWTKGKHNLRFGGEYRQILANNYFYNAVIPVVNTGSNTVNPDGLSASVFPGGISATDLSHAQWEFDTITGLLASTSQGFNHTSATSGYVKGVPRVTNPIQHNLSGYAQDSWRVKPGLTLQIGTRWEFQGVFDDRTGLVLLPQNATTTLWGPTAVGNYFTTATNGVTDSLLTLQGASNGHPYYKRDWNNFAPFVGLAWDPWKNGKTSIRASFSTHYTQDGFTFFAPASTANAGLFTTGTNSVPTGVYSIKSNPLPSTPADVFPVSQKANFAASNAQSLTNVDPNLVNPYILEWSVGIQRELPKRLSLEVRYAGNHAVKQYRAWNINELDLNNNGLMQEFLNAQNNLNISQARGGGNNFSNQGLPGQVALPTFDKIFQGIAAASGYTNSTFITNLQQNTIGTMFDTIRRSPTYRTNITNSLPLNFFVANPWANQAVQYDNSSWSYYDGLEVELNRRMSNGLIVTATYTFSKVLSDANFLNSQTEAQNYLSVLNRRLDKFRAGFDATHSVAANFLYPLPFGRGKHFLGSAHAVVNTLVGGWTLTGFSHIASGNPITLTSGRATTGSLINSTVTIRNMTQQQLQKQIGVFRGPNGVYFINPDSGLITIKGSTSTPVMCTAGSTAPCFDFPGAGQLGNTNFNFFSGPHFFGQDASIIKHTRFGPDGRFDFQIRLEMFNVFNTAVFTGPGTNIQTSTFGQLTSVLDTTRAGGVFARTGQWAVRLSF